MPNNYKGANQMQAYLNDPKLKADFLDQIRQHQEADRIIQGTYGDNDNSFKGCAVGCSIRSLNIIKGKKIETNNHAAYETELGMPEWLARLEDTVFEGLPIAEAKQWPLRFAEAIPVGADLEPVKWKFCAYLMKSNIERILALNMDNNLKEQVVTAIRQVLSLHENAIATGVWDESAAESARSAARSAWSAAESARSAAESAAWSAWSAAESARSAWSAAESAARPAEYTKHAYELLKLLGEAGNAK